MENKEVEVLKFRFSAKLATYILSLCFIYFFTATFLPIPDDNMGNANTIIGFLILNVGLVIGYYFGSSQSPKGHKTEVPEEPKP